MIRIVSAVTPLGASVRGMLAGAVGSYAQTVFLQLTSRRAPATPKDVFLPPEQQQKAETSVQTVARRTAEGLAQRGPLTPDQKEKGGLAVHLGFGAAWGQMYGLAYESHSAVRGPAGAAAFGAIVWMVGDNVLLPVFRLAAWPQRYPAKVHAYALAAHFAYGFACWGAYAFMRSAPLAALSASGWALLSSSSPWARMARILGRRRVRRSMRRVLDSPAIHAVVTPFGRIATSARA